MSELEIVSKIDKKEVKPLASLLHAEVSNLTIARIKGNTQDIQNAIAKLQYFIVQAQVSLTTSKYKTIQENLELGDSLINSSFEV